MSDRYLIILTLLIGLLLAEFGVRHIEASLPALEAWPSPETELKADQMRNLEDVDLVIVGSSVSEAAIDPDRLYGISAYNAALPFSSLKSNILWLENSVFPRLSPSVVLIGLSEWSLVSKEDLLYAPLDRIGAGAIDMSWWQSSALLRRRSQLRDWDETIHRMRTVESGLWTGRGHQTGYYHGAIQTIPGHQPEGHSEPDLGQVSALREIIRSIRSAGALPVVLIEPERCPPTLESCAEGAMTREALLAELVAADVDLIIEGNSVEWPAHMFADDAHFNRTGTLRFTEFISEQLGRLISRSGESTVKAVVGHREPRP